jgi:hypothetical protein
MNDHTTQIQNGTGCDRCGAPTSRRRCKKCADVDRGDHTAGGEGGDGDRYECVECGTVFVPKHGTDPCPDCGSYRHVRVEAV